MAGYADNVIKEVREHICRRFSIKDDDLIDNFLKTVPDGIKNVRVWCLGDSIRLMSTADLVIFAPGWDEARGCRVEHKVCEEYGIPFTEVKDTQTLIVSQGLT
jgi:hypothetical protein